MEVDVFARHLDEAKGDVRLQRVKSRFESTVEFSPERLLLGRRLRLGQQDLDEDKVWGGSRPSDVLSAQVVDEFGGRQAHDLLYPRFGRPTRTPESPHRAFFYSPTIALWEYRFTDGYDDEQHRIGGCDVLTQKTEDRIQNHNRALSLPASFDVCWLMMACEGERYSCV